MLGLITRLPHLALAALVVAWVVIAAPGLLDQYSRMTRARAMLVERSVEERTALFEDPGFRVAEAIQKAVPPKECVAVLAYAGPAAIGYYKARFPYFLYPRRVKVFTNTAAFLENCRYLAVFRNSPEKLASEPFAGSWNQEELNRHLESLRPVSTGDLVKVYRAPSETSQ